MVDRALDPRHAPRFAAERSIDELPARGALLRHQIGAVITTAIDFGTMIALVRLLHARPSTATIAGAAVGAITNFTLGRYWIFDRRETLARSKGAQAARYALVSGASLGLNALGEHVLAELLGVQFVLARTIVAVAVSLGWNFPMQRRFVYAAPEPARPRAFAPREATMRPSSARLGLDRSVT